MKSISLRRGINILLLITILTLFTVSTVAAATTDTTVPNKLNLTYLINGMDLNPDQFNKTLKLTKDFLNQIERSSQIVLKLSATANSKPMKTDIFTKITTEQYQFLTKMKLYRQNLIKAIGEEKAGKIYTAIYNTIPNYLLPEKAVTGSANSSSTQTNTMGEMQNQSGAGMDSMMSGQMNSMDSMNMSGSQGMGTMPGMGNMGNMPGMNSNGATGATTTQEQLLKQLQASNAMLIQMLTTLQSQGGLSTTQYQLLLQLLNNQQALIRLLTTNPSNSSSNSQNSSGMNMGTK